MSVNRKLRIIKKNRLPLTKKSIFAVLFALYIVFILVSQIPFVAENLIDTSAMEESYEYHLSFPQDGKQGHYYVERYDTSQKGRIHVIYTTESNSLEVECTNIKVLKIYCREMYEKKSEEVLKRDPELDSNYYKTYFITRDHFHVHVFTEKIITQLEFIDTPIPYNVTVNGQEWWLTNINYTYNNDGIVITKVPSGHSYVDIYFQPNDKDSPVASFTASKIIVGIGESISFNATASNDPDGQIISYAWDLGDGAFKGGVITQHSFENEGNYKVILTVTDDDYLINRAYQDIKVVQRAISISISVDKLIATPGSILTYTITPALNASWEEGVKDIIVKNELPDDLDYVDATPLPTLKDKTITWRLGIAFDDDELSPITLQATVNENINNNTIISNYASLEYKGIDDQIFPEEISDIVDTKVNVDTILAPTIKERVRDVHLKEDDPPFDLHLGSYEYDFQDSNFDLNWYITDKNESLYQISGEYSENDVITITPSPEAYGDSLVTLWLIDSEGFTTNQPLWINITPVNDPPTFSSAPDLILHYEESYTFDYEPYIYDIDTPKEDLQLFVTENPGGSEGETGTSADEQAQVDNFKVTYNFPESYIGKQIFVSLIVFDGTTSDGDTIQINVTEDYTPVLKKELPDVRLEEGETKYNVFDIDEYFEDPDGDSLFYSFGETHVRVYINVNHSVDITAPTDWNGVDTVTFRARDPIGAIAEDTILVTVLPINDPPVISGVPEVFVVHYDSDYSFDLTPYVSDEDNELSELFLILVEEHLRTDPLNQLKIIMNYPKSMLGLEIKVLLTVSDGIDTGVQEITVKVTDNWPPEIVKEMADVSFYEDERYMNAFNLNHYFSDKDSKTLYYSFGQKFVNITINSDGWVDFSAALNWNGVEIVTFRATDPTTAFVEDVIIVTVLPVNDPPEVKPLPMQSGMINRLIKFDLSEYIFDVDNDFSELTIEVVTFKLDIMVTGNELMIYSEVPITENVTITVSDGLSETKGYMIITMEEDDSVSGSEFNWVSFLWLFLLIIILIICITGVVVYRRFNGNYNVEEIFCIYNNGILISHVTSKKLKHRADEFVVSGMLTAIINFTQEAFTEEEMNKTAWGIKEIQMNEKNILVERGKYTFLATVFSGRSGKKLYNESRRTLSSVEKKYKKDFMAWNGNLTKLTGTKFIIKTMLNTESIDNFKNENQESTSKLESKNAEKQ